MTAWETLRCWQNSQPEWGGGEGGEAEAEAKREEYVLTIINSGTETCEGDEPFHTKKSHADKTGWLALKVKELSVTRRAVEQR